jgi:hypothetical protein
MWLKRNPSLLTAVLSQEERLKKVQRSLRKHTGGNHLREHSEPCGSFYCNLKSVFAMKACFWFLFYLTSMHTHMYTRHLQTHVYIYMTHACKNS